MGLEVDDEAGGDAGAIGVAAGSVEADVVQLGTEGQVWKEAEIHAAANAIGKLVGRTSGTDTRTAKEGLRERMDVGGVTHSEARADKIGVGIQGNAAWRVMVATEISGDPEPMVEIVSNRTANAVLVETSGASQAEVGIAERGIYGLGARRDNEYGHCDQEKDELFHRVRSFRALKAFQLEPEARRTGRGGRSQALLILM
jgi:hypothetical protein